MSRDRQVSRVTAADFLHSNLYTWTVVSDGRRFSEFSEDLFRLLNRVESLVVGENIERQRQTKAGHSGQYQWTKQRMELSVSGHSVACVSNSDWCTCLMT